MTIAETVNENGCTVCEKSRPSLAVSADDPFCSSRCAKTYHRTVMKSSGFSGARQQGDKNGCAEADTLEFLAAPPECPREQAQNEEAPDDWEMIER